jgi:hypothetical protein
MLTSNIFAPQAIEADLRGSEIISVFASLLSCAQTI